MRLIEFHLKAINERIYINPGQVSCLRMGDSCDSTFVYLSGLREPFEVKGDPGSVMEELGFEFS